jgi:hypothetical protein
MWCLCTYRTLETLGKCWAGTWFGGLELRTTGRYQVPVSVSKNQTGTSLIFGTRTGVLVFSKNWSPEEMGCYGLWIYKRASSQSASQLKNIHGILSMIAHIVPLIHKSLDRSLVACESHVIQHHDSSGVWDSGLWHYICPEWTYIDIFVCK